MERHGNESAHEARLTKTAHRDHAYLQPVARSERVEVAEVEAEQRLHGERDGFYRSEFHPYPGIEKRCATRREQLLAAAGAAGAAGVRERPVGQREVHSPVHAYGEDTSEIEMVNMKRRKRTSQG